MALVDERVVAIGRDVQVYIDAVLSGERTTGKLERLAVERHVRDLETGSERGLRHDPDEAARKIGFIGLLKNSKGEWAGSPIELFPWQLFMFWCLFGWKRANGTRRFREAYISIGRKGGKSTVAAATGHCLFVADNEPGAEVYSAATKRDQAKIIHDEAKRMVQSSNGLSEFVRIVHNNMSIEATNSKYEPIGADADTTDGLNASGVLIDELHAHKTRELYDVLDSAMGARRQPLIFSITTAGFNQESIGYETDAYACDILDGTLEDDEFFVLICRIDAEDDPFDEACWIKANPGLGATPKLDDMRRQAKKAKASPSKRNEFIIKRLNRWVEQEEQWLDMDRWDACSGEVDAEALKGETCVAGLDLASTSDLTAFVLMFHVGNHYKMLPFFWLPEDVTTNRKNRNHNVYAKWVDKGLIRTTPGNTVDYDMVRADINELGNEYGIADLAVDRNYQGAQLSNDLFNKDGFNVHPFNQSIWGMAAATLEFETLVNSERLEHGGHPIMRWMAKNTSVARDTGGNMKPDRKNTRYHKIDGIVCAIMAIGRAMVAEDDTFDVESAVFAV